MKKASFIAVLWILFCHSSPAQNRLVDSMLAWIQAHPKVDSQYILTLHRISYRGIDEDLQRSFSYYEKVSYYSDSLNFVYGKALAQINLGILFSFSGNYDASNQAYFKAMAYADTCQNLRLQAVSLNNIGDNFKQLKDFGKCREYATEAILINRKLNSSRGVAINFELIAACNLEDHQLDSAKLHLDKGFASARLSDDSSLFALYYLDYGIWWAAKMQMDSASACLNRSIAIARRVGDPENEFKAYLASVTYLPSLSNDAKLGMLHKAMAIARDPHNLSRISEAAHQLYIAYDKKGMKDSSQYWFTEYHNAVDSLVSLNNRRGVAIKETEWMVKRKEIENSHLKELATLQEHDLRIKNGLLLAVLLCMLLGIIIAVVVYRSARNKKKSAESELRQNIAETQMQALRSQMNPHFIFNSLNSIDAFIQSNDKYNATVYLNKFAKLIRNVLDGSKQNLVSFSKDMETLKLYIELEMQRSEQKFKANIQVDDDLMNSDYKVPPLIVQPFVENAIIHGLRNKDGNDGLLTMQVRKNGQRIVYVISDNGVGRAAAAGMNTNKDKSYGLDISYDRIRLFNKESEASVHIEDLQEKGRASGTRVTVELNIV